MRLQNTWAFSSLWRALVHRLEYYSNAKLWCWSVGNWNTKIWIYQLSWYGKLATLKQLQFWRFERLPFVIRRIRSDEGLSLKTSAFEFLLGGQFNLSTQLINSNVQTKFGQPCFVTDSLRDKSQETLLHSPTQRLTDSWPCLSQWTR